MATTSLKLPDGLKARATAVAKRRGISTHAFLVEAINLAATAAEQRARFVADARAARATMLKSGSGFDADEVHAHLLKRVARKPSRKPRTKSWRG
jgi:predicted transcriptional regulator